MKVVITGATGNVGTSVVEALGEAPEIERVVGLARRRPSWEPSKTRWEVVDILDADLASIFAGADAVIHLAWAIQPSRDSETLERINLDGSRRVFDAVAEARVPKLIYASSVGAYSPGPKDREVDEDWPTDGIRSSFYSHHKALVEDLLDGLERRAPNVQVVRMRPALIFKGEAATEIRRLFIGPFLPSFLVRAGWIPAIPRLPRLRFQAVHSADVGRAYALATVRDVSGAFNLAAEPSIGAEELARVLDARTFPLPASVARRLVDLSWRLRLQPTPPGWLDMALAVPLMSSRRAREELGWEPQRTSIEALEELLEGIRRGRGKSTPPLESTGVGGRLDEVRTGVGGRQWPKQPEQNLVKHLTDVHSIEQQALTQMRKAPDIAGEERLGEIFEAHMVETEIQERRVRERLEAHDAEPSTLKDLAGKAGGVGMLFFAASQPDTPGKLTAHAFSYEHLEVAAYGLLRRTAEEAGDEETARMAEEIGAEEQRMADRLEGVFDLAVEASLRDGDDPEALAGQLDSYLADAHAIEQQALQLLEAAPKLVEDEALRKIFEQHLAETELHELLVRGRLKARGMEPSKAKDAALRIGGLNVGAFFAAQPDTAAKLAGFAFAFEHLEIAAYELLERVARRAGDEETVTVAERILAEERAAASKLSSTWDAKANVSHV
jgi:ferritin-like metal-binding protein YciE/nucleoside-diphosphate-sugar epimerase